MTIEGPGKLETSPYLVWPAYAKTVVDGKPYGRNWWEVLTIVI